jgi:hypothetical protein
VRTVHVEPEYEFTGHVDAPSVGSAAGASSSRVPPGKSKDHREQKNGGFWAGLKRLFGGG